MRCTSCRQPEIVRCRRSATESVVAPCTAIPIPSNSTSLPGPCFLLLVSSMTLPKMIVIFPIFTLKRGGLRLYNENEIRLHGGLVPRSRPSTQDAK